MNPETKTMTLQDSRWAGTTSFRDVEGWVNAGLALALIALFLPLMALIALLILCLDRRPVLYRGRRLGLNGRAFTMYKFRTLREGAESKIGGRLLREGEGWITPLGRLLRRSKLDELPQLFNILKRDMNFVGPRPVRPLMAEDYAGRVKSYASRFAVRPGMTGLAQLRGGYYCEPGRKTRYDLFYIRKKNLILDLKLLGLTAARMVFSPDCLKSGDRPTASLTPIPQQAGAKTPKESKLAA